MNPNPRVPLRSTRGYSSCAAPRRFVGRLPLGFLTAFPGALCPARIERDSLDAETVGHDRREVQVVRQPGKEPLAVVVAPEDLRAAVTAAGDMIDGVGEIDARWARHTAKLP
jgi:hypothetical protein